MPFVEPIAAFFVPGDPGVVAATINGATVYGDLQHDLEESLDSPTRRSAPMFSCAKAALPALTVGDPVTIGALSYTVRDVEGDDWDPIAVLHLNNP